jgi:spermidine/putrescine transport system substrate-binding protein
MADKPMNPMTEALVSQMSRRRFLRAAGVGGAALAAAACGAGGGSATPSGSGTPTPSSQPDRSDTEKVANWSTWVSYIDTDDETGERPSLARFEKETGIKVTYTEDVNDNNDFYAKVRAQLEQGRDIGRDIVVLTDWMAALWISRGFALPFNNGGADIANKGNLLTALQEPAFDPGRLHTMPWQSGFAGLGYNKALLKEATGKSEMKSVADLWDPALKGKVTILSEMRDSIGVVMLSQGNDPSSFTDDEFNQAADEIQKQLDAGQIRQVTGNDYLTALENGDVIAVIGWSGDVAALGGDFEFRIPESGGTIWTDNMLIPAMAAHQKNAEKIIDFYYDPANAAEVAAYVQYVCPVEGAKEEIAKIDPSLVENQLIFPDEETLSQVSLFMTLTPEQQNQYDQAFLQLIGA